MTGPLRHLSAAADRFANICVRFFSSKWTVVLFAILPLVAAPQAVRALLRGDFVTFIGWLSSNYWQLLALPALAYATASTVASHRVIHRKLDDLNDKVDAQGGDDS